MTLSGKMAVNLGLLTLAAVLLGAGTIAVLSRLHDRVDAMAARRAAWIDVYRAYVTDVGTPILMARRAVEQQPVDAAAAGRQLRDAATGLSRIALPDDPPPAVTDAFDAGRDALRRAEDRLRRATAGQDELDVEALRHELDSVRGVAAHLTGEIRASFDAIDRAVARQTRNAAWGVAGLAAVVVFGSIVISLWQYRSVMRPIRHVTDGVRRVAAGRFDQRLDASGNDELARLARDFNQMAEQLETLYRDLEQRVRDTSRDLVRAERLASVGYLAAGVAHEINNPLGIIAGRAELALHKLDDVPEHDDQRRVLRIICDEAFRCKAITEKLLSLSRGSDESRQAVDLAQVAREVAEMIGQLPRFGDREVAVRASDEVTVDASEAQMKQVILNLAINALDATATGDGRVGIDVSRSADHVVVRVTDNGRGMDEQTIGRVFEPFFTARRGAAAPGTGLGLSICHAIVTDHGGTIHATSPGPEKGSTFTVELPAVRA